MPSLPPTAFRYVECDIPEGLTVDEWKHPEGSMPSRGLLDRLLGHRRAHHRH